MLCLSKKTEYALAALGYLAERSSGVSSAREIAVAHDLPLPLLSKILKSLQHHGMLISTRGVQGGYRVVADLNETSLFDLVAMMECPDKPGVKCGCVGQAVDPTPRNRAKIDEAGHAPVLALQNRLVRFLKDVKLSDLVLPGRRIDVLVERLSAAGTIYNRRSTHAHSAH